MKAILNEAGMAAWTKYENPNPTKWNEWKSITSEPRSDGGNGSVINISTKMPSFAFEKFEVRANKPDKRKSNIKKK